MGKFYLHLGPALGSISDHNLRIFQNLFWMLGNHKCAKSVYVSIRKSFFGDLVKTWVVCTLSDTIQKCKISFIVQPLLLTFSRVTAASSFSLPKLLVFLIIDEHLISHFGQWSKQVFHLLQSMFFAIPQ